MSRQEKTARDDSRNERPRHRPRLIRESGSVGVSHKEIILTTTVVDDTIELVAQRIGLRGIARADTMHGRPHRVVPAVLVRSQVLHNNLGRSYLPAEEITDEWAEMWNGIPVLIGDHPRQHGEDVSGRDPGLWNERQVGFIFNARAERDGQNARLLADVWLDETRASAVQGFQEVLDAVAAGRVVELSTGFRTRTEHATGSHDGAAYELIMHPVAPDHLVISVEMTGACSVQDGCGLGANGCQCGGRCRGEAVVDQDTKDKGKANRKSILTRAVELLFGDRPAALTREEIDARRIAREVEALNAMNPSDQERMNILRDALQAALGGPDRQVIVADVFSEEQKVIYWFSTPIGAFPVGSEYFMTTYTLNTENGATTFGEPTRVRRMTTYETVANSAAGQSAGNAEVAAAANASPEKGKGAEMSDEIKALAAQVAEIAGAVKVLGERFTAIETAAKADPNPAIAGLKATIAKLSGEFAQMREVTTAAVEERERERQELIRSLVGHVNVPFNEVELESKPLDELRKLATMAAGANFQGRGGPQGGKAEEGRFAEPTSWFAKDKQTKEGGE